MAKKDLQPGEIEIPESEYRFPIPTPKDVKPVSEVAGRNPTAYNLKDHPELKGKDFICMEIVWQTGTIDGKETDYLLAYGYILGHDEKMPSPDGLSVIITGSENIKARLSIAQKNNGLPCRGQLRNEGRAWFYD